MSDPTTTSELPHRLHQELEMVTQCAKNSTPLDPQAWQRLQAFRSAALTQLLEEQYLQITLMLMYACKAMLDYSMGNGGRADSNARQAYVIALDINNMMLGSTWLLRGEIGQDRSRVYALRQAVRRLRSSSDPLTIVSELRARHQLARRSAVAAWWHGRRIADLKQQLREQGIDNETQDRLLRAPVIPTFMQYGI